MKKTFFWLLALSAFSLSASSQSSSATLQNTVSKLTAFSSNHITEKAYLQFDKPYYAAGDTIYFKAYVTMGNRHQPSFVSNVLHVDFINPKNKIDQSIKLQIDSGACWGDFALPDSLLAGNYRIRAYTQWMRNNGDADFFNKSIPVGSLQTTSVLDSVVKPSLQTINNKPDLQFFPEGGNLVTGIRTKIAFKAVGTNGLGMGVKGVIVDNQNKEICALTSTHAGAGYFFLSPVDGATYKAKVTFVDGTKSIIDLPKSETSGISLSVTNSITKATISIAVNPAYHKANQNKKLYVVTYSGGKAITAPFVLDTYITTLDVMKWQLYTGVASVTLFSENNEPLCERLLFVQNNDQLNLHITTDKTEYAKREKVNLLLYTKNKTGPNFPGRFSISVIDENKVPAEDSNATTLLTDLLLTSDLKGYIEQPDYYFNDSSETVRNNLDVLMLTQGYRHFEWKQVLDSSNAPVAFAPEKGFEISGAVTNLSGKPLEKASINLFPADGGFVLSDSTDKKGMFHFSNLIFMDTFRFVLNAANAKGRNLTKISYFADEHHPLVSYNQQLTLPIVTDTAMSVYLENAKKYHNEMTNYGSGNYHILKAVTVTTKKLDNQYRTQSLAGAGHADQVMHAEEIEQIGGQLSTSLYGRLRGVGFANGKPYLQDLGGLFGSGSIAMLVVVDGNEIPMDSTSPFSIDDIPSSQVETVEVLKYTSASIYGMNGANGVLVITTKQGEERYKDIVSVGVLPIAPMGFYKARTFYSPKYDYKNANSKHPDLRSTIYWNPDIRTDKDGNASMDFYNADGTGTYKVVIEGMDSYGNIGSEVYRYQVK